MSSTLSQACESKLYVATMKKNWEEVVKIYEEDREMAWLQEITNAKDTALHMAINEEKEGIVEKLVSIIVKGSSSNNAHEAESAINALKAKNESGDTPLHRAAAGGSVKMCEYIINAVGQNNMKLGKKDLLTINNDWGQNPLMVATLNNRKNVFFYLVFKAAADSEIDQLFRCSGNGDTILHAAIKRDHYDLAFHMIKLFPDQLLDKCNSKGMTPLHVLASKPSAFKSGYHVTWRKYFIYHSVRVEPLKYDPKGTTTDLRSSNPYTYLICPEKRQTDGDPENPNSSEIKGNFPPNYDTCFQLLVTLFLNFVNLPNLGFVKRIKAIIRARQSHKWSIQLLDEILKHPDKACMTKHGGGKPFIRKEEDQFDPSHVEFKKENQKETAVKGSDEGEHIQQRTDTALLVATQKGVIEVVEKILQQLPLAIHDTSLMNNRNIMLIAAENRRPIILQKLKPYLTKELNNRKLWDDLIQAVDTEENTMLHLAAYYDDKAPHAWQNQGSALQMQRETKWYKYVSSLVPSHFVYRANQKDETPRQIFTEKHKTLVKEGCEWLKDTSESCSVVAALVAGVTFATSCQIPGGADNDGKPNLEGKPAFELFAFTALLGLCFSVTSLIMFLSILTDRKQAKDFRVHIPWKLLIGLSSLFVSIGSMLISFCGAYYYILNNKLRNGLYPLYAVTCFPLTIYAIAQFPLYWDLLWATISFVPQLHEFPRLFSATAE